MAMVPLQTALRPKGIKAKRLRRDGQVPCIVYGNAIEAVTLVCMEGALHKAFVKAGQSTLVELAVDDTKIPVLFHAIDLDPVTDRIAHVDFYAVDMKKEVEASVPVHFEGESLAVKELSGILVTILDHVTVRCLPADLPASLTVSLNPLTELHMHLTIKDIALPKGVAIVEAPDTVIVIVQEQRAEEVEEKPVAAAVEGAEGTVPAEGAAPAEGAPAATAAPVEEKKEEKKKK